MTQARGKMLTILPLACVIQRIWIHKKAGTEPGIVPIRLNNCWLFDNVVNG
ncbi:hypothetical protein ccbrp13_50540 [Ktedonobacteria bacterium brp13]|nr:hypothetical protein ccbrp13_50540 [Ktedonobacteria bacterium brp13]